jgi:hypothetical protein
MGLSGSKSLPTNTSPGGPSPVEWPGERLWRFAALAKHGAVMGARFGAGLTLVEVVCARRLDTYTNAVAPAQFYLFVLVVNVVIGFYSGAALGPVFAFVNSYRTGSRWSRLAAYILFCAVLGAGVGVVVRIVAVDNRYLELLAAEKDYLPRLARMLSMPAACGAAAGVPVGFLLGTLRHLMVRQGRRQADGPARGG